MDEKAIAAAREVAECYLRELRGDLIDGVVLVKVALAGYLAASGVPTDGAVAAVEKAVGGHLLGPVPANPMFHGLPWLVPGPASGAPYYKE